MHDKTTLQETVERVYQYMIGEHAVASDQLANAVDANPAAWGLDIEDWEWNPGVGVTSIMAYYEATQRADILRYLVDWVRRNEGKAGHFQHVNKMAPFAIFPRLYRHTGDLAYLETGRAYADWIVNNSVRTLTGALQHGGELTEEIWADTIFMAVLFLARQANVDGDRALAAEAARQLLLHLQYLQDPETDVLFHGYDCAARNHKSGARWTRGNGWIAIGTPLILAELAPLVERQTEIEERYRRLIDGLLRFQAPNGLWHTVMERPDLYQETSGSAAIGCGILKGIALGLLETTYAAAAERTVGGVLSMITPDGQVASVSGGTPIMQTIDEYGALSRYPTLYGQGLALMLLAERIQG